MSDGIASPPHREFAEATEALEAWGVMCNRPPLLPPVAHRQVNPIKIKSKAAGDDGASGARNAQLAGHARRLQARLYTSHLKPTRDREVRARALRNTTPPPTPFMWHGNVQHGQAAQGRGQGQSKAPSPMKWREAAGKVIMVAIVVGGVIVNVVGIVTIIIMMMVMMMVMMMMMMMMMRAGHLDRQQAVDDGHVVD
jgi:hypothetical protein